MTTVNIALPAISDDLGAGVGELQWVVDGFLVALAGLLLVGSGLADRFGRRRVFLGGFAAFAAASVLRGALEHDRADRRAGAHGGRRGVRAAAGAGADGGDVPARGTPARLAIWATFAGVGMRLGPVVGGILVPTLGWQSVFLINVPFALVAVPAGHALLPESTRAGTPPLDLLGAALSILGLTASCSRSSRAPTWAGRAGRCSSRARSASPRPRASSGSSSPPRAALRRAGRGAPGRGGRRGGHPRAYIAFLGIHVPAAAVPAVRAGPSVLASAAVLSPIGIAAVIAAPFNAAVLGALGARWTIAGGLSRWRQRPPCSCCWALRRPAAARDRQHRGPDRRAIPLTVAPATAVIMDDVGEAKAGDGGAVNQLARQVGGALGVAIVGSVFAAIYTSQIDGASRPHGVARARPASRSSRRGTSSRPRTRARRRSCSRRSTRASTSRRGPASPSRSPRCCSAPWRARSACGGADALLPPMPGIVSVGDRPPCPKAGGPLRPGERRPDLPDEGEPLEHRRDRPHPLRATAQRRRPAAEAPLRLDAGVGRWRRPRSSPRSPRGREGLDGDAPGL